MLLNPKKRAFQRCCCCCHEQRDVVNLSKSARDTKLLYTLLFLDVNVRSSGQNFFSVNFPSSLFVCGPFFLRSSSLLRTNRAPFSASFCFFFRPSRRRHKSFFTPRTEREKEFIHIQNDDDAFLFCEDSPNGGGREHQGTLLFFCCFKFSLCAFVVVVYVVVVSRVYTIAFLFGGDTFWIERERCWNPATRVRVRRRRR